jgi:hypothetical protein
MARLSERLRSRWALFWTGALLDELSPGQVLLWMGALGLKLDTLRKL